VKKHVKDGIASISLEDLRSILDPQSVKDADGNVIHEALVPVGRTCARGRVSQDQCEYGLKIKLASIERSKHRWVVALKFTIKTQGKPQ
jgi:hypothetical protein